MKKNILKRTVTGIVCAVLLLSLAACGSKSGGGSASTAHVDGTLSEIFKKIYDNADVESPMVMEVVVDDTNKASMIGTDSVSFVEGLASEAAIMTIPHSMVLLRVDKDADVENIKKLIKDNVDPRKWICVGVEQDQVIVDNIGDLVFLVMSANADAYYNSFLKLAA